jgi:hypothetical protein
MAEKREVEYVLFPITERDVKQEYPELAKVQEFENLSSKELRVCWLIGNPTSPIFKLERVKKIKEALTTVYGTAQIESKKELKDFYESKGDPSKIPSKYLIGIERMLRYNIEIRLRGKLFSQYLFESMTTISKTPDEIQLLDIDEQKKYMEMLIKINTELPKIIESLESGYGVKLFDKKDNKEVKVSINTLDQY